MYSNLFSPDSIAELTVAMQTQFPKAIWETFYVTLLSTALAVVIGLPLGVLLVAGRRSAASQGLDEHSERHHQPAALDPVPHLNDHGLPALAPYHRHDRRHHRDHRSAGRGGVPVRRAPC